MECCNEGSTSSCLDTTIDSSSMGGGAGLAAIGAMIVGGDLPGGAPGGGRRLPESPGAAAFGVAGCAGDPLREAWGFTGVRGCVDVRLTPQQCTVVCFIVPRSAVLWSVVSKLRASIQ